MDEIDSNTGIGPCPPAEKVRGELAFIDKIRARATQSGAALGAAVPLGIGDDCAILAPSAGQELVVTTDFSLEDRHFRRDWHSPQSIGHRALARGLSDVAAMGARPMAAFLSLALPKRVAQDASWVDGFLDGLLGLAKRASVPLAGGDTSEAPDDKVLIDIVLIGSAPRGKALRRSTAKPGDRLFVTGALGGAAYELQSLSRPDREVREMPTEANGQPHLFPEPRLEVGAALMEQNLATAAIDVSDGLSTDLKHLCTASDVCAELDLARLPFHHLLSRVPVNQALSLALHGGEDYELLFTATANMPVPSTIAGVPITEIGRILACAAGGPELSAVDVKGRRSPLIAAGWEHLQ